MTGTSKYAPSLFIILATIFAITFGINYEAPVTKNWEPEIIFEEAEDAEPVSTKLTSNKLLDILGGTLYMETPIIKSYTHQEPYEFDIVYNSKFDSVEMANYISSQMEEDFMIVLVSEDDHELVKRIYDKTGQQTWPRK